MEERRRERADKKRREEGKKKGEKTREEGRKRGTEERRMGEKTERRSAGERKRGGEGGVNGGEVREKICGRGKNGRRRARESKVVRERRIGGEKLWSRGGRREKEGRGREEGVGREKQGGWGVGGCLDSGMRGMRMSQSSQGQSTRRLHLCLKVPYCTVLSSLSLPTATFLYTFRWYYSLSISFPLWFSFPAPWYFSLPNPLVFFFSQTSLCTSSQLAHAFPLLNRGAAPRPPPAGRPWRAGHVASQ